MLTWNKEQLARGKKSSGGVGVEEPVWENQLNIIMIESSAKTSGRKKLCWP